MLQDSLSKCSFFRIGMCLDKLLGSITKEKKRLLREIWGSKLVSATKIRPPVQFCHLFFHILFNHNLSLC